jgi:hypothetical protein
MALDERLLELLMRADELRERGAAVTAEELCSGCPELLPVLRRLLEGTGALEQLLHVRRGPDPVADELPPSGRPTHTYAS